jgi:hypothetical protein
MIFKIQLDLLDNLFEIIEKLSSKYEIIFFNNNLYLSYWDDINKEDMKKIKKILSLGKSYYISEINENNLKFETKQVVDWCRDKFIKSDLKRFEKNEKEKILTVMEILDEVEIKLKEQINNTV